MQYDDVITNPRWRTDAILKIVFWLYLGAILADQREIWNISEGSHADIIMSRDQNCNFRIFKMADGRHFENSITSISQPRNIRFRSNLVCRCTFQFLWWTFNKNSKFCKFKMADGRHIENRFLAISRRHTIPSVILHTGHITNWTIQLEFPHNRPTHCATYKDSLRQP